MKEWRELVLPTLTRTTKTGTKWLLVHCILARRAVEKPPNKVNKEDRIAVSTFSQTLLFSGTELKYHHEFNEALRTLVSIGVYKKEARKLLSRKGKSSIIRAIETFEGFFDPSTTYQIPPAYKKTAGLYIELRTEFIRRQFAEAKRNKIEKS